jgi:hypothetical protein
VVRGAVVVGGWLGQLFRHIAQHQEAGMDATAAGSQSEPGEPGGPEAATDADEQKRRFMEALEAKRGNAGRGAGGGPSDSKIHSAHGKAGAKRQFRRKSGG